MTAEKGVIENGKGILYLLPVPLGEGRIESSIPEETIKTALRLKHFIVENVRTARRFLKKCSPSVDIDSIEFVVLDEHTAAGDVEAMLKPLEMGEDVGLMSEAGCPAVADPGALAVAAAQRKGYRVKPLTGPSSILLSLMASGFNGQNFAFNGYLPVDQDKRAKKMREMVKRIENEKQTQIFIETPYRNGKLMEELCKHIPGNFLLCVASDLTTENERVATKSIREWAKTAEKPEKVPTIFLLYSD